MTAAGLLLAAGRGRRMGRPKALVHASDGSSWLLNSRDRMLEAGCAEVLVVLGAEAEQAMDLLGAEANRAATLLGEARSIVAERWADGMGESMRAGLLELIAGPHDLALVHLVDLPDVNAPVMRRLLEGSDASSLKRAVYGGSPGHPVVVGRDHWQNLVDTLAGDTGAKEYLRSHGAVAVECGDLATGRDVDTPDGV